MKFRFDAHQQFQQDAISSVVDLFKGQPADAGAMLTSLHREAAGDETLLFAMEIGAVGNNLVLDHDAIVQNLTAIQDRNGLEVRDSLEGDALNFDVEMETGTGKTYVYLRSILELAKQYSFTKFIILVPSVAIKEGVTTSVGLMREHFNQLYSIPFDVSVYNGKSAEEVQTFATSTNLQIMVMTIDAIRGDKSNRIIHQNRDKLNGLRPIDYLAATAPVVIMDEPQNMESELSQTAINELNPLCTLRYSATHKKQRNVVYRLDPVDAHEQGLVKQIVVADVSQQGADPKPYVKLIEVKRDPWTAKLELVCQTATGLQRKVVNVGLHKSLADISGNEAYGNNWRINEISLQPAFIELANHGVLELGESIGASNDLIYREMLRETIKEHLRKEALLRGKGIKVLSLFFIDKVANYLSYGDDGTITDGKFAQWFDELFVEERDKFEAYRELLPQAPQDLRRAYFAEMRKQGSSQFVDSTERGSTRDDDAYDLIMRDKARLLDNKEPVRFIFSHSALREGWDNPNVFQICALREMGEALERRQTIGRGLRLPVDEHGERVRDRGIAQLTVIANESYRDFASSLQQDYIRAGVSIGVLRRGEFSKLFFIHDGHEGILGYRRSDEIWEHLRQSGFIDFEGRVLGSFTPTQIGFTLNLPEAFRPHEVDIINIIDRCKVENFVKAARSRLAPKLNKELYVSAEFEDFWNRISKRTTYRVSLTREDIIRDVVAAVRAEPAVEPLRIQVTRTGLKILRGGPKDEELGARSADMVGSYDLPDIVQALQEATSLTRRTLVDILIESARLQEFILNPNDFIQMMKRTILTVLAHSVGEGIQYEEISGSVYELRELQKDGREEKQRFIDQMYKVKNEQKTDFDYVVYDSDVERQFAEKLDSREDIKMFMKLPAKFKVPTPVGDYNPDWAIVQQQDGRDRIYMIRETKSTSDGSLLRSTESAKIKYGTKHFEAIGIDDFAKSSPDNWRL